MTVKNRLGNTKCSDVALRGPAKVVYRPDKPLSCGATCWIETDSDVATDEAAKFAGTTPSVQINMHLVGYGYQMDILVDGKPLVSECRDFGGTTSLNKLKQQVVELAMSMAKSLREKN